jgi:hypothetical protein
MEHAAALEAAIYLMRHPSRVRLVRSRPLPDGVVSLLRIAAEDGEVTRQAALWAGKSPETIRQAAGLFLEQILFDPDADSYRVPGAAASASNAELRRNMALLLRWIHPDLDPKGERSVFARRVTLAWNDLKTQERRDAYDRCLRLKKRPSRKKSGERLRRMEITAHSRNGRFRRIPHPALLYRDSFLSRFLLSLFDRLAH